MYNSNRIGDYMKIIMILTFMIVLLFSDEEKINKIIDKIIKVETSSGKYNVKNKTSGAYGRYQIMPKTAKYYCNKLKIKYSKWKSPKNQDKIFKAILKDNIRYLEKNNFPITAFTVYGCHQQGAKGFKHIMTDKEIPKFYTKLRKNLPSSYKNVKRSNLRSAWIAYWFFKLETIN